MEQKIHMNCSPKTFRLIRSDERCQKEILNKFVEQEQSNFEQIIITETQCEESQGSIDSLEMDTEEKKKNDWLDAPTKLLISLVKEFRPHVGKSFKLKTKKKMWLEIANKISAKGYSYTAQQVETKYYSLERQYKKNKLHNSQTGRNRQTCLYQAELDELMQERKSINPEFLLNEDSSVSTADEETYDADTLNSSNKLNESFSSDATTTKRKKNSIQEQIIEKIDLLTQSSLEFERKTLQILEMQNEREKRKEERAEREEERKKRKLELMEQFVSKINNQ